MNTNDIDPETATHEELEAYLKSNGVDMTEPTKRFNALLAEAKARQAAEKGVTGECHYCGVPITEANYQLREVRTWNELGDHEPCCDDCAKATSGRNHCGAGMSSDGFPM